jgi:DNA-binding transcriptional ArsR family regulator
MATTNSTGALDRAARRATVRQLADKEALSARAIARRLGIGKDTVRRDLEATEPTAPQDAPETAPPAPTSGAPRAPYLLHDLEPALIQDLNVLHDARTGELIGPVRRYIRAAANARRADLRKVAQRICAEEA